jgi:hypothetical protein
LIFALGLGLLGVRLGLEPIIARALRLGTLGIGARSHASASARSWKERSFTLAAIARMLLAINLRSDLTSNATLSW